MSSHMGPSVTRQQKKQEETFGRNNERIRNDNEETNKDNEEAQLIEDEMETEYKPFFGDCPGEVEDGTFRLASVKVNTIGIGSKKQESSGLRFSTSTVCKHNWTSGSRQEPQDPLQPTMCMILWRTLINGEALH